MEILINFIDTDTKCVHSISISREILVKSCHYFQTMLENFSEADSNSINITIKFATNAKKIIAQLNGYPCEKLCWSDQLQWYYCCEFFGMDYIIDTSIIIPSDKFDEFLDLVDLIGYHDSIIKIIANNIPIDYDFDKLPSDLLIKIRQVVKSNVKYDLITESREKISIYSGKSMENYFTLEYSRDHSTETTNNKLHVYAKSKKKLMLANGDKIDIYDDIDGFISLLNTITVSDNSISESINITQLLHHEESGKIVVVCRNNLIHVYDICDGKLVKTFACGKNTSISSINLQIFTDKSRFVFQVSKKHWCESKYAKCLYMCNMNDLTDISRGNFGSESVYSIPNETNIICHSPNGKSVFVKNHNKLLVFKMEPLFYSYGKSQLIEESESNITSTCFFT